MGPPLHLSTPFTSPYLIFPLSPSISSNHINIPPTTTATRFLQNGSEAGSHWPGFFRVDTTTPGKEWVAKHRMNSKLKGINAGQMSCVCGCSVRVDCGGMLCTNVE